METGAEIRTLTGHTGMVYAVSVTPDGKHAVSASMDNTLKIWDMETGAEIRTLAWGAGWVHPVSVTPDGKRAVSASNDSTLKISDMEFDAYIRTFEWHKGWVNAVIVTPDGKRVVSAYDNTLKIWDIETGAKKRTLTGYTGGVIAVSVTPDSKRAVSASNDSTLKIWDMESGRIIAGFCGDSALHSCVIFPDGKTIAAGEASGRVHFLRIEEKGIIPETRIENKITCPKCGSDDVTFSKKKQLYVCPDCHHEFVVEKKI
jgi:WD40 repeat protein